VSHDVANLVRETLFLREGPELSAVTALTADDRSAKQPAEAELSATPTANNRAGDPLRQAGAQS
jgi:hypothetical protein